MMKSGALKRWIGEDRAKLFPPFRGANAGLRRGALRGNFPA